MATIIIIRKVILKNTIGLKISIVTLRFMPGKELLEIYKDCGGKYVTLGSDAHEVKDLGADNDVAQKLIKDLGLHQVIYESRKRIMK